jgi:two-component system response regulator YesN
MGYNLLIVDDEEIAIKGIVHGLDWSSMPIANIYTACDAEEAQNYFREHTIHVLLSDIDMPNQTGIELLSWVNVHSAMTKTILLTGHADFKYAQQALQLDGFDYLLKPVDHSHLQNTLARTSCITSSGRSSFLSCRSVCGRMSFTGGSLSRLSS